MNFITAVKTCFSKYVTFQGRARRAEYWWWTLFVLIGNAIFGGADTIFFGVPDPDTSSVGVLAGLFSLAVFLPGLSVWVRRLHDINRSGWWAFLILIPIIGWVIMLVWALTKGTEGANRFGPDPITE
ncbi:DUF805 domain-containing protein [Celeribacter sp. PS-C1]|uniref:DUF805 domain-containing protein n=1 Tax=Celeribacter sp. PS-C1 TaxID=2820813 RepID=UPI001C68635B|nr:DUF805 domain-containing protein [Celeribacter sp. PS-C1]MBW6417868.1 DUF805 domain-containing protein [Celeribacter sp. PS-C1]